jgi:hypothetical protein
MAIDPEFGLDVKITNEMIESAGGTYGGWKRLALIQARRIAELESRVAELEQYAEDLKCNRDNWKRLVGEWEAKLDADRLKLKERTEVLNGEFDWLLPEGVESSLRSNRREAMAQEHVKPKTGEAHVDTGKDRVKDDAKSNKAIDQEEQEELAQDDTIQTEGGG